ncbi:MAG: type VI secretion system tip protein VgrG [Lentisphaerae bacterium]|nr:type VI secretion system tip protein VgrG [Lentisphaerota bacterium]MCP4102209.1 type VI secretion system tip protein VgrG [Lentisphaerota bacterium]
MTVYSQDNRNLNIEVDGKTDKDEYGNNYVLLSEISEGSFQELSKQFHIKLVLLSPSSHSPLTPEKMLGCNTTVKIKKDDGSWRLFNGILSNFTFKGYYSYSEHCGKSYNPDLYEYSAVLSPKMLMMKNSLKSRIFHSKKPTSVIKQILNEWNINYDAKLENGSKNNVKAYYQLEQIVQYKESDFDFISRLMQKDGIYYYFWQGEENGNPVHKLILRDSNLSSQMNLIYDYDGGTNDVTSFYQGENVGPNNVRIDNYDYRQADVTFFNYDDTTVNQKTSLGSYAKKMQCQKYDADFICTDDKSDASKYRKKLKNLEVQRLQCANFDWQGLTQNREIIPGKSFTMTGYPAGDVHGLITRLEFTAKTTSFSVINSALHEDKKSSFNASFYAQDLKKVFRPQQTIKEPKIFATVNARIITEDITENYNPSNDVGFNDDLGGNPVYVDKKNRIKILMNWRNTKTEESTGSGEDYQRPDFTTMWLNARFGQLWADPTSGKFDIPRKGQEVLVTFVNGNLSQPVVIGSLYNSVVTPPIDTEIAEGVYGSLMRTTGICTNNDDDDDDVTYGVPSSFAKNAKNTMPLPMSAFDLGKADNQKGYNEISMYSMDNSQFSESKYDDTNFMCSWFFPAGAPPVSTLVGYKDGLGSGSAGKNMFFEGINMYSNKDVLSQATQNQVINAGANVQISAATSITLQVGRSKISITDNGIIMKNTFGAKDKYAGYLAAYQDVDDNAPSKPSWGLNSFSSQLLLLPGLGAMTAPLSSVTGTYLANVKTWWGSECGGLIGNTGVTGMATNVKGGFDIMSSIVNLSKLLNELTQDTCNNVGTKASLYGGGSVSASTWLVLQCLLIKAILETVFGAATILKVMFTMQTSAVDLKYNKMSQSSATALISAPSVGIRGNPLGAYIDLFRQLQLFGLGGGLATMAENAAISGKEVNPVGIENYTIDENHVKVQENDMKVQKNDGVVSQSELQAQKDKLSVSDDDNSVVDTGLNVTAQEMGVSSVESKISETEVKAVEQQTQAYKGHWKSLIVDMHNMDIVM